MYACAKTQKEVMEEMRVDLEKRARRLVRRLEDEEALNSQERSAHESAILAVRAQVNIFSRVGVLSTAKVPGGTE